MDSQVSHARNIDLNGTWELRFFDEVGPLPQSPQALDGHPYRQVPAQVPGNVELDLARAGQLPSDLFHGLNILELRPFENYQWWYHRTFSTPDWTGENETEIVFEGLDCFATIWINGVEVGRSANALIAHRFNISSVLAPRGETNQIDIRLASPINAVKDLPVDVESYAPLFRVSSLWARKPAHSYGWDIMPRALSAGIWRSVRLEEKRATELTAVFIDTKRITADQAVLECHFSFRTPAPLKDFTLYLAGACGDSRFESEVPLFFNRGSFDITVSNPRLWWPRGYGDAALYDVTITLINCGRAVSERRVRLGIRKIELDRTDLHTAEKPGRFSFVVNGVPIFCRGTNWVPPDVFHSRDAERMPRMLELVTEMECNMVRSWGGSVYEPHAFYDFLDQEGILVWQDFGMACAAYPQRVPFLESIREEAEWVVAELRQHPCIALWCGDNEIDEHHLCYWTRGTDPNHNRITRDILPEVLRLLDPRRPFMASSPYLGPATVSLPQPNRSVPEQHLWGPRNYYKSEYYLQSNALFASEIGYHGSPGISAIRRFISPDKLWPCLDNDEWHLHSTDPVPEYPQAQRVRLMLTQIRELFGEIPDGLDHFVVASQIVQAEAKKFFVEFFRQQKGTATGILWWNMIDGWPQFSDAIVDYYFGKKLAFHYLKRVHQPFAVIMGEAFAGARKIFAVNDSLTPLSGRIVIRDADSKEVVFDVEFKVGPNDRTICGEVPAIGNQQRLYLMEWDSNGVRGCSHYLAGQPPFPFEKYRHDWLPRIALLDDSFAIADVGR
jgi:beta-mannosidase